MTLPACLMADNLVHLDGNFCDDTGLPVILCGGSAQVLVKQQKYGTGDFLNTCWVSGYLEHSSCKILNYSQPS